MGLIFKKRGRFRKWVILAVLIFLFPYFRDAFYHDYQLFLIKRSLLSLQHPENTSQVKVYAMTGQLVGNSNHCDFFVGELRHYNGDMATIQKYYASSMIKNPVTDDEENIDLLFFDHGQIIDIDDAWLPRDLDSFDDWQIPTSYSNQPLYCVMFFRNYKPDYDLRCH